MLASKSAVARLYDEFFLKQTFDSLAMKESARKEIESLVSLLPTRQIESVLDIPCGTGRQALEYQRFDFKVTDLDVSPFCIKLALANIKESSGIKIIETDFLEWNGPQFDLVSCLGVSIGYSRSEETNSAVLAKLASHVKANGFLAIQFLNRSAYITQQRTQSRKETDKHFVLTQASVDTEEYLVSEVTYISKSDWSSKRYNDEVKVYEVETINKSLSKHGFKPLSASDLIATLVMTKSE